MAQSIADGFVQCIVAADILTLEKQFSVTGQKTAVSCPGLAVKWCAVCKTVCQIEDPLFLPWNRSDWCKWLICGKIIIKNTISGAAGRSRRNIIFVFLMRLPGFIFTIFIMQKAGIRWMSGI